MAGLSPLKGSDPSDSQVEERRTSCKATKRLEKCHIVRKLASARVGVDLTARNVRDVGSDWL